MFLNLAAGKDGVLTLDAVANASQEDLAGVNEIGPVIAESVHERYSVEIFRGCTRGCRFSARLLLQLLFALFHLDQIDLGAR